MIVTCFVITDDLINVTETLNYYLDDDVLPYRRFCDCLLSNGTHIVSMERCFPSPSNPLGDCCGPETPLVFTKEDISRNNLELTLMRDILMKGDPEANCPDCGGTGIMKSKYRTWSDLIFQRWNYKEWDDEDNYEACLIEPRVGDALAITVENIDAARIPIMPDHVFTPEGDRYSREEFFFFGYIKVEDDEWETTVRSLLERYNDASLVLVKAEV